MKQYILQWYNKDKSRWENDMHMTGGDVLTLKQAMAAVKIYEDNKCRVRVIAHQKDGGTSKYFPRSFHQR